MKEPIFIKDFLPTQLLTVVQTYCLMKYANKKKFHMYEEKQCEVLIDEYGDPLMETLMDLSTPVIESNVGKKLFPTYSFFRIYDKGSDLPVHTDRDSCEYTVAFCIGCDPIDKPYEIFIGEENKTSDYKYVDKLGTLQKLKINYKFPMLPNSALLFQGVNKNHWREKCEHDNFISVFFHYVDQEGEFSHYKYDKRSSLGFNPNDSL